jgi:hypothetical protein
LDENGFEIEKMQGINPVKIIKKRKKFLIYYWLIKFIFGKDVDFLQFGVRVKKL